MESIIARQYIRRRSWLPILGLGACVAGMPAAAHAQDFVGPDGKMYSKRLIVSMNPTATSAADDKKAIAEVEAPPPPPLKEGFYETELKLRSISTTPDGEGGGTARVVKGTPSGPGAWKSAVNIEVGRGGGVASCGASVIDVRWVLTAAHCLFDERKGGLQPLQWITIYEGSNEFKRGRAIRAIEAHVHKQFKSVSKQLVYDIALIKLEKDATAPRQKLASYHGISTFLKTGNIATVVGWGKTDQSAKQGSPILLQADVPVVETSMCHAIYPNIGQFAFCAGYKQGGTDTCQGDSGGPLYLGGANGEHVQAGITSFGYGCAQPDAYGVYTNLGLYEQWIKEKVPNASFVSPASGSSGGGGGGGSVLADIAGFKLGGPPAPKGQVSVDIKHVLCPSESGAAYEKDVNRIKTGSCIKVRITSGVTGHLRVFSLNAKGEVHTMFPNKHTGGDQMGASDGKIQAGRTLTLPGNFDNFFLKVSPPFGRAHVIAIVVGEEINLDKLTGGGAGKRSGDLADDLDELARQINAHPLVPRGVGTRQYEVVE